MAIHGLSDLAEYTRFLNDNNQEVQLLFRDPETWDYLVEEGLPELLANQPPEHTLRAWVVGCSTGEEAYSLAIAFTEALERTKPGRELNLQIFASDISPEAITIPRRGQYPLSIKDAVSEARLARFFTKHDNHYRIRPSIRDKVLFARHDVILDPPFTKLDLIAYRNLLIYFDLKLQQRILPLFHYSLRPNGLLMLGSSETIGRGLSAATGLFTGRCGAQCRRGHRVHQRAYRQVSGARSGKSQLEHPRHGPGRTA